MSGSGGRVLVFTRGPDSEAIVTDSMITISSKLLAPRLVSVSDIRVPITTSLHVYGACDKHGSFHFIGRRKPTER